MIDPLQLDQILMNLSVNAHDAMPNGGSLTLETANVRLNDTSKKYYPDARTGDFVLLSVSDTGHGMSPEVREHIFEPFFTTKRVGEGTGLGLSTVYGIVTQNNGFITVDSAKGRGTVFEIYLPRHMGEVALEAKKEEARLAGTGTILLVEDEEMLLWMTTKLLEEIGYKVIQAGHPKDAIAVCERGDQRIDLILTDVVMPDINGREMVELIRLFCPGVKALFMSGYSADIATQRGILEEGVNYIQKPFNTTELNDKLTKLLS
jgi:CheY-like chemotaxis protein